VVVAGVSGFEVYDAIAGYCVGPFESPDEALAWRRSERPLRHRCHLVRVNDGALHGSAVSHDLVTVLE